MALNADRYLKASQQEIQHHIATAIPSERQDAIESAGLVAEILGRLAADLVVLPAVATPRVPAYRVLIHKIDAALQEAGLPASVARDTDSAVGLPPLQELEALRGVVARAIDNLEELPDEALRQQLLDEISALDCEWRTACVRARDSQASTDDAAKDDGTGQEDDPGQEAAQVTAEALTAYLRRKFPDRSGLTVTGVRRLAGGRSKDTFILTLEGAGPWPEDVVMRQDAARHALATLVVDEYRVLNGIDTFGVKAPKALMLEPETNELGNSFYLMEMLPGEPSGTYYVGLFETDPDVRRQFVLDVAEALGKLHSIDPSSVLPDTPPHVEHLLTEIRHYKDQWRASTVEQSPMIAAAFVWLESEVRKGIGEAAILHGDVAVHNMLTHEGRLTALLDWELFSVGDAAADLAYFRPVIESAVPWSDFMDAYVAAGGHPIDERRLKMFAVWGFIRNASIVAGAAEAFQLDPKARFEVGYMAAAVAFLEEQLVPLLNPSVEELDPALSPTL